MSDVETGVQPILSMLPVAAIQEQLPPIPANAETATTVMEQIQAAPVPPLIIRG